MLRSSSLNPGTVRPSEKLRRLVIRLRQADTSFEDVLVKEPNKQVCIHHCLDDHVSQRHRGPRRVLVHRLVHQRSSKPTERSTEARRCG